MGPLAKSYPTPLSLFVAENSVYMVSRKFTAHHIPNLALPAQQKCLAEGEGACGVPRVFSPQQISAFLKYVFFSPPDS